MHRVATTIIVAVIALIAAGCASQQPIDPYLRVGDPVRIDGSGNSARVTRV